MTTEARTHARRGTARFALALLLSITAAPACADSNPGRRGDRVDVSSYPPEIQDAYRVFALRCSRCHSLARPLGARIDDPQHWVRYVTRMRRQPGSGIDAANAEVILQFLFYYHGIQRVDGEAKP